MFPRSQLTIALAIVLSFAGCKRGAGSLTASEYAYVSAPQAVLRDRVSQVFNKVGIVKNGEKVTVLDRDRRFVHVRTASGLDGWMEERYLADDAVYDAFQALAKQAKDEPVQGRGTTRAALNMHISPARDSETLFQMPESSKVEILERATAERLSSADIQAKKIREARRATFLRQLDVAVAKAERNAEKDKSRKKNQMAIKAPVVGPPAGWDTKTAPDTYRQIAELNAPPEVAAKLRKAAAAAADLPKPYDDWWLVRDSAGRVGWVLARMVDLEIPLEVAQYAEGQRIMGAYILNTVHDEEKGDVPQFLVVLNETKDGTPWDFNQFRVFSWNRARHRYETAYRERNLVGFFPVKTGTEDFGKEGVLPTFTVIKQNDDGSRSERKYRMIGPIVRQVLAPGEESRTAAQAKPKETKDKLKKARPARRGRRR